jgi:hypothetical protein
MSKNKRVDWSVPIHSFLYMDNGLLLLPDGQLEHQRIEVTALG